MSPPLRVRAPAKTNLFLEVTGRRADGFHDLDTVFAELELADELLVEPLDGALELRVEGDPSVPADERNLAWRAAAALRAAARDPALGARITLRKAIPAGGGLGGGSSDAAAVLRALDALWGSALGASALAELAAGLGSDVPFFLAGGLQRGRGRGEQLEPLPRPAAPLDLVLLLPGIACPTPAVYRALAPHLPARPRPADALLAALAAGDPRQVAAALFNRLEAPAFALWPELARLRAELSREPEVLGALLSGSGSTLFALVPDPAAARALAARLAGRGLRALPTRAG